MASITSTVRDFKREPERYLPDQMIHDALDATQHLWRDRLLGPVLTRIGPNSKYTDQSCISV